MRPFLILLATLMLALPSHAEPGMTVQAVLDRHAQALGPVERVQTRRLKLRVTGMAPFDIPVVIEAARPNLIRKEVILQGQAQVTSFDGQQAWKRDPFVPGGSTPFKPSPDDLKVLMAEADFDGALINPASKGAKVSYLGPELVNGKGTHKLQVVLADGAVATVWLDATTFLETKRSQLGPVMGQMKLLDTWSSDYRVVQGVKFPHRLESGLSGAKERIVIFMDAVEFNPPIERARFQKP